RVDVGGARRASRLDAQRVGIARRPAGYDRQQTALVEVVPMFPDAAVTYRVGCGPERRAPVALENDAARGKDLQCRYAKDAFARGRDGGRADSHPGHEPSG